ncbi:MAG: DMT family transporter [Acidilobaceae archaeon]
MEYAIAYLIATSTGLFFGLHDFTIRIASYGYQRSSNIVLLSLLAGFPVMLAFTLTVGFKIGGLNIMLLYALAGVVNFPLGRTSMYKSISRVGAGLASLLLSTSIVYNMFIGVLMGENLGAFQIIGSLLILASVAIAVSSNSGYNRLDPTGIIMGLIAGLLIALSIAIARLANIMGGDPVSGAFIAYTSGLLVEALITILRGNISYSLRETHKRYLGSVFIAGVLAALGQIARYIALATLGVSIVTPLQNIRPVIASIVSGTFSKYTGESLAIKLLISGILAFTGGILIYL